MSRYYIYKMEILDNEKYYGSYIGQHKVGKKAPSCDGYMGSGSKWKKYILKNNIPVKKAIIRICDSVEESNYWERHYIKQAGESGEYLWNMMKGVGNYDHEKPYTEEEIREHNKERFKKWYAENKKRCAETSKRWREKNRERVREINRRSVERRREFCVEYQKQYYQNNKEKLNGRNKEYYLKNKERLNELRREYYKEYYVTHAKEISEKGRKYYAENKEKHNAYYTRMCLYEGKTMTLRALSLKLLRQKVPHPTEVAKQYLIDKENNNVRNTESN